MKLLIEIDDLKDYKSRDKIPLECYQCKQTFYNTKNQVLTYIKTRPTKGCFCSHKCGNKNISNRNPSIKIECECKQCHKKIIRNPSSISKFTKNTFCCSSCAASYNNTHKTKGTRRSKLEVWIESQLKEKYSNLNILYNNSKELGFELDIYIPSLKLAFELNGIYHYEPIYGQEKLQNIQLRDQNKFQKCIEKGISLCVIDTYNVKYFKKDRDQRFLDIITKIIDQKCGCNQI